MDSDLPSYSRSARTDFRIWGLFLLGVAFAWTGSIVDPATNCDEAGDCAPWLVPLAKYLGFAVVAIGLAILAANPRRGSKFDPASGDLIWWQQRFGAAGGDEGRIHPSQIGRILIVRQSESDDETHLYNLGGERQFYFDSEVIPWPYELWAEKLTARWPHIVVEIRDS